MAKKVAIGLVVVALLAIGLGAYLSGPSDEQLVREALYESIEASRNGQPGGVMEHLSRSITFNEIPVENRQDVANFIRNSRPSVNLLTQDAPIRFEGSTAEMVADFHVVVAFGFVSIDQAINGVQVRFRRETATRWLVLPASRWRISEIRAPAINPSAY